MRAVPEASESAARPVKEVRAHHKHSLLRRHTGYRRPGAVAAAQRRCAEAPDLQLEEVLPREQLSQLDALHTVLLGALGLNEMPTDWRRSFFTQARLLTYLRADRGSVEKAAARAAACIQYCEEMWASAYAWEAQPDAVKDLYDQMIGYGSDGIAGTAQACRSERPRSSPRGVGFFGGLCLAPPRRADTRPPLPLPSQVGRPWS